MAERGANGPGLTVAPSAVLDLARTVTAASLADNLAFLLHDRQYTALARLLRLNSDVGVAWMLSDDADHNELVRLILERVPDPWATIFKAHVHVRRDLQKLEYSSAVENQMRLTSGFLSQVFARGDSAHLPVLYAILEDLAQLAILADEESAKDGHIVEHLQRAMQHFQSAFASCMGDRNPDRLRSKKAGALHVVNVQMRVFFRADQTALIAKLFETVDHRLRHDSSDMAATAADIVTYRYWYARDCLLNDRYVDARYWLEFVLEELPVKGAQGDEAQRRMRRNVEWVLRSLIPLRIAAGTLPTSDLLARYPRLDALYAPVVAALVKADLQTFDAHLANPDVERHLTNACLLDLVRSIRWLVVCRVVKKAWLVAGAGSRLRLDHCQMALTVSKGSEVGEVETEAAVSTLIAMGLMTGYVSTPHQLVVLAKANTFPKVQDQLYTTFELWDVWNKTLRT
ncbi:COP9 signalosome (CSN) subunit [Allomyces javanicus]|nr:COP9 signalosome (CSN) subunit [Allomyces javanicus]